MSFSNTTTGDKPADPYKKQNEEDPDLNTKVEELVNFITTAKFGMMTTHEAATDNLVSRCMALAATVCSPLFCLALVPFSCQNQSNSHTR